MPNTIVSSSGIRRTSYRLAACILLLAPAVNTPAADSYVPVAVETSSATSQIPNEYQPGTTLTLAVLSRPYPTGELQWLRDEQPLPGATTVRLALPNLSATDAGNYRLRIGSGPTVSYSNTIVVNVLPSTLSPVDTSFTSHLPGGFTPSALSAFAQDGSFVVQLNSGIMTLRLNSDGSLVSGFDYPASAGTVLAGFPDGRLITANAPYLLAVDGKSIGFTLPPSFDATQPLSGAAVANDGKFYLSQGLTIARFRADGVVDPTFSFTTNTETAVTADGVDRQGRLYVTARRVDPNPSNYPPSWNVIYRLDLSGAKDTAFPEQTGIFRYASSRLKVVPLADGRIFSWSAYHGYYDWRIYHEDGSIDTSWSGGVFSDYDLVVDPIRAWVYVRLSGGILHRFRLTATGLEEDTNFFPGLAPGWMFPSFNVAPDGKLMLFTNSDSWEGHATQNIARIRTDVTRPVLPPAVSVTTTEPSPARGATVTLQAHADGDAALTYQWLALDGQPLPANTISPSLVIPNFTGAHFGRYQVRVNGAFGSELSHVVVLGVTASARTYLANLSGRAVPGAGEDTAIAGFTTRVYAGALGVPLLIRGVGPGLKDLGVTNFLPNPALNLFSLSGAVIANNDNWSASADRDTIRTNSAITGAFALAENSLDSALLKTSYNEQFTVQLLDQSNTSGAGLLEIYRVPQENVVGELTNLSLRARSAPGDATAIAGFVIVDPQNFDRSARVLLRVVGPTLSAQGVQHPLGDPLLTVFNSRGQVVAQNDDWALANPSADASTLTTVMKQVGAFDLPTTSKDAALLLDLPAGAYTMHATGGTGVALLEIYLIR